MFKKLLSSRKFVAVLTGMIASVITMLLGHFLGDTAAQVLSQNIAGLIMVAVSVYAGAQGIADHGDVTYGKEEHHKETKALEAIKAVAHVTGEIDLDAIQKIIKKNS